MFKFEITESYLYSFRYYIGYAIFIIGLITTLFFVSLYLPGGLSDQEIQSVIKSDSINRFNMLSFDIINLPFHLLQKISITLFGFSILSIKLPSIILALLSTIGLFAVLGRWFKPRVAILTSLIAITTGQFLFIAQNGKPDILYLFWPISIIFIASHLPFQPKYKYLFSAILFSAIGLSLYTPLSVYILVAVIGATLFHPHLRFLLRQLSRPKLILGLIFLFITITPLLINIIMKPSLIMTLLGIPSQWPDIFANLKLLGIQYLGFSNPYSTTLMTPFFELGSMLIIAIGMYNITKTIETAKSYIMAFWSVLLIPVVVLNPNFTSITYLPLVMLLASGISYLSSYWYGLFPKNPYARVGGLIPLTVLISVLVFSGADRYVQGYRYDPNITSNFSKDLKLIPDNTKYLLISNEELPFYQIYVKYKSEIKIIQKPDGDEFLASNKANTKFSGYEIKRIITTSATNDADRFYLYKKIQN